MPWWLIAAAVLVIGAGASALFWAPVRARDEARHAEQRRPDPGPWLLDKAGVWWVLTDVGGYVRVPPELQPMRTTIGPKDPPRPVSREWIAREIGIAQVVDPRRIAPVDGGLTVSSKFP